MKLELQDKRLVIFGMSGEGKSNLLYWLLSRYGSKGFVYDTMHEYLQDARFDSYRPENSYGIDEMSRIIRWVIAAHKYKFVAIDEANRFCPSKPHPLPDVIAEINDCCRHPQYGFTPAFIARRPTQLNQDLSELAHYMVIFNLKGKNDIDYLNDFAAGLGDTVLKLPQYHFVLVNQRREWQLCKPVPKMQ